MMTSCLTGSGDRGWMDRLLVEHAHTSSQLVSMMVWLLGGNHWSTEQVSTPLCENETGQ